MLFNVRICEPVKRAERVDEELLFLLLSEAQCTEDGVPLWRENLDSEADLLHLFRVGNSKSSDVNEVGICGPLFPFKSGLFY